MLNNINLLNINLVEKQIIYINSIYKINFILYIIFAADIKFLTKYKINLNSCDIYKIKFLKIFN